MAPTMHGMATSKRKERQALHLGRNLFGMVLDTLAEVADKRGYHTLPPALLDVLSESKTYLAAERRVKRRSGNSRRLG